MPKRTRSKSPRWPAWIGAAGIATVLFAWGAQYLPAAPPEDPATVVLRVEGLH